MTGDTPRPEPTTQAEWHQHNGWHHHPPLPTEDVDHWHGPHLVPDEALSSGEMDCRAVLRWWQDMALSQGARAERAEARDATGLREAIRRNIPTQAFIKENPRGPGDGYRLDDVTDRIETAVRAALAAAPQEPRWPSRDELVKALRLVDWEQGDEPLADAILAALQANRDG